MASGSFGRSCSSQALYLTDSTTAQCFSGQSCKGRTNQTILAEYLEQTTDWKMLWQSNNIGGWICREGRFQHPLQELFCCGDSRSDTCSWLQ